VLLLADVLLAQAIGNFHLLKITSVPSEICALISLSDVNVIRCVDLQRLLTLSFLRN
jgi:hypothetical protein